MFFFIYFSYHKLAGGLFGSQPQQTNSGMSLFNTSNQPPQQSSIFAMPSSQPNSSTPNLFGSNQQTQSHSQSQFPGFGNQQTQQTSLFGGSQTAGAPGPFGQISNPNQGNSIFGSNFFIIIKIIKKIGNI